MNVPVPPGLGFVSRHIVWPIARHSAPGRRLHTRIARGSGFLGLSEPCLVVLPDQPQAGVRDDLEEMFEYHGFRTRREGITYHTASEASGLDDHDRRRDTILVGTPDQNPLVGEIVSQARSTRPGVLYHSGEVPAARSLMWRNHVYRWRPELDFGVVACHPNPLSSEHRIWLLFGLGETGTRAAVSAFCRQAYRPLRALMEKQLPPDGFGEVLLAASSTDSVPTRIRIATTEQGEPADGGTAVDALLADRQGLRDLFDSLTQNPPPLRLTKATYTLEVDSSYGVRSTHEEAWEPDGQDIVIRGKEFRGTPGVTHLQDVDFTAECTTGEYQPVVLPAINEPMWKAFLLFPVPPVLNGSPTLHIRTSGYWPGAANGLQVKGRPETLGVEMPDGMVGSIDVEVHLKFNVPGAQFKVVDLYSGADKLTGVIVSGTDTHTRRVAEVEARQEINFRVQRISQGLVS